MTVRPTAVAGTWYPGNARALAHDVDEYIAAAGVQPHGDIHAIIAPHAGLMFSGPVGAYAYAAAANATRGYDVAVLVGPSHFYAFDGVALYPEGAFATPFGEVRIDADVARALATAPVVQDMPSPHAREHSLEMQLPFVARLLPGVPIVPLLIGHQRRQTIEDLAAALAATLRGRRALLVASTDLSHYFDAATAERLDGEVCDAVAAFDPARLLTMFERHPDAERGRFVGCGMGAAIAVIMAARSLGAQHARVLRYAHSGHVSGDPSCVVGYLAAALGTFDAQ